MGEFKCAAATGMPPRLPPVWLLHAGDTAGLMICCRFSWLLLNQRVPLQLVFKWKTDITFLWLPKGLNTSWKTPKWSSGSSFNLLLGQQQQENQQSLLSYHGCEGSDELWDELSKVEWSEYYFLESPLVRKKQLLHWEVRFIYSIYNISNMVKKFSWILPTIGEMRCFCGCQLKWATRGVAFHIKLVKSLNFVKNIKVPILKHPFFNVNKGKLAKCHYYK